jgi:FKBP-type peptidyl-prolyl cis-trans isomerase (trigger factor)
VTTDAEIDDELLRIRKSNSTRSPATTVADDEHIVTADIQQLDEGGSPLIGKKSTDASLYPAGGTLYKEIRDALANAAEGSTVRVKFDVEDGEKKQTNHLDIHVKKIEKVTIPAFDDAFVQQITKGKTQTAEEFRTKLREDIEHYWKEQSERHVTNAIIAEIVRRHAFTVPESLIAGVTTSLLEDVKSRQPNQKLPADFNEEQFREENREYATFQAKWYLLRSKLVEAEHLAIDDADYEQLAAAEAERMGIDKERLIQFYKTSDTIGDRILGEKLTRLLRSSALVTEKTVTEQH